MQRAFLLTLLAMAAMPAHAAGDDCAPEAGKDAVLLTIDGFKNRLGNLRVELWPGNEEDFLRDHHQLEAEGKAYRRITIPVPAAGAAEVCMPLPGPGIYALGAFHSPSSTRKFNIFDDGATFTRNPKVGILRTRPRAADVAMQFNPGLSTVHVTLNYLQGLGFGPAREQH